MKFAVATGNVLYESYYLHYTEPNNVFISAGWRARAFEQAFKKNHILNNCDIYCFQEWPYKPYLLHARKNQYIKLNGKYRMKKGDYALKHYGQQEKAFKAVLAKYCPQTRYTWLWDGDTDKDGILTLVNKSKFAVLDYEFVRFEKSKKMGWVLLETKRKPRKKLSLINTHLPLINTERYLKLVAKSSKALGPSLKLICGDLNYESFKPASDQVSDYKLDRLKKWFKPLNLSPEYLPVPTSITGSGMNMRLSDYIFFSPQLKPLEWDIYPGTTIDLKESPLIKHKGQKGSMRQYFSDHAIIKGIFEVPR